MPRTVASTSWHHCSGCGQWIACDQTGGTPWARLLLWSVQGTYPVGV